MRKLTRGLTAICLTAALITGQASFAWADESYGPGFVNGVPLDEAAGQEENGTANNITQEEAENALANAGLDIGQEAEGGGEDGVVDEAERAAQEALKANFPRLESTVMIGGGYWSPAFANDAWMNNNGQGLQGLSIFLTNIVGNIHYRTYVTGAGWTPWVMNGQQTVNYPEGVYIEAVQVRFSGYVNNNFDIYYTAMLDDGSTVDWGKNGATVGTMGTGHYITGLRLAFYKKNAEFPYSTEKPLQAVGIDGMQEFEGGLRYFNGDGTPFTGWAWQGNDRYYFENTYPVTDRKSVV